MSIEIRGEDAVKKAQQSMNSREVFVMFGIKYTISRVVVEYREISDVVFAQVELSRMS